MSTIKDLQVYIRLKQSLMLLYNIAHIRLKSNHLSFYYNFPDYLCLDLAAICLSDYLLGINKMRDRLCPVPHF